MFQLNIVQSNIFFIKPFKFSHSIFQQIFTFNNIMLAKYGGGNICVAFLFYWLFFYGLKDVSRNFNFQGKRR